MRVARTRKVTDNTSLMSEKTFADLKEAMEDALLLLSEEIAAI
jgi:hypothetical protein